MTMLYFKYYRLMKNVADRGIEPGTSRADTELAGPMPECVTQVVYGLEPRDLKNFVCRISAPLPRSFPSISNNDFSFTILRKLLNIPPYIITAECVHAEYTILGNFPKLFSGWGRRLRDPLLNLREGMKMEEKLLSRNSTQNVSFEIQIKEDF